MRKRSIRVAGHLGVAAMALLFAIACSSTDTEEVPTPVVSITGGVAVEVGATLTLTAATENGMDDAYTWASDDESVATVADGVVMGVAAGEAVITATGATTGAVGSWGVNVVVMGGEDTPMVVVGGPVGVMVGETITLAADTMGGTDSGYTWASSSDAIATVVDGVVTGVAAGDATITATGADTGASGDWGVHVYVETPDPGEPVVVVTGLAGVVVGGTVDLTAATVNGTDSGYTWETSNAAVATVEDGVVTGVAAGEATITATGADTGAEGDHAVFVVAEDDEMVIPAMTAWAGSGHADAESESFRHWDEDGEVAADCAKCHSTDGFRDFLGDDGTAAGVVDGPAALGGGISCEACHNGPAMALDSVEFPSGEMVAGLGAEARCLQCHQGRESTVSVDEHIAAAEVADDDTVDEDLGFRNVHYYAAGATLFGKFAKGGYEYADMAYDGRFAHVEGFDTCVTCHNPHSLEVKVDACAACHEGVVDVEDLRDIRMISSTMDYDGDGDTAEGMAAEIEGLIESLYAAMQDYATNTIGTGLVYEGHSYPYFFIDTNGNGEADDDEVNYGNQYATWTARLVRAAYNYQYALKDTGAYAHNGKYVIQLLFDAIDDLGDAGDAQRIDTGHFAGSGEAFRHWDADGEVSADCARCHSAEGLPFYLEHGVDAAAPIANGFQCVTCHADFADLSQIHEASAVSFPSGVMLDSGSNTSNLCMSCHQGRESGADVAAAIEGLDLDTASDSLRFLNVHYFAAGATRYGSAAGGGFEYEGMAYNGWFEHAPTMSQCADCHNVHTQAVKLDACTDCHEGVMAVEDLHDIRMAGSTVDYDGDGLTEGIAGELATLNEALYAGIQQYASEVLGTPLIYEGHTYPYFFNDSNANGAVDPGEAIYPNAFSGWSPRLLKACYNFQYVAKDPGAYAHNPRYIAQLLYDSLYDLSQAATIDISAYTRDPGPHFNAASEGFRHWDGDGEVEASCAQCHAGTAGFVDYIEDFEITEAAPLADSMTCDTCHTGTDYAGDAPRRFVEKVVFPGGVEIMNDAGDPDDSFLCMTCHQGRESKATVDALIASGDTLRFLNLHYVPAGAILYGHDAMVGYEYDGQTYEGQFSHYGGASAQCGACHELTGASHSFHPMLTSNCTGCHSEATAGDVRTIRKSRAHDYDGDGNMTESLHDEFQGLNARLYTALQAVADANGSPLVYDSHAYPYFFHDTNGNGEVDAGENIYPNQYTAWTAQLLRAAFNYQASVKEPGAWAHNTDYMGQLLYDAISDLGGDMTGLTRP